MIGAVLAQAGETLSADDLDVAQNIAFGIIAVVMVYSALRTVTTANVVHAALYLVIVLAGVAALFIMLGSDFVGATQVLVYIGAVVVLFLFGIMLTKARLGDDESVSKERRGMGALVAVLLLVVMVFALVDTFENTELAFAEPNPILYTPTATDAGDFPTPVTEALPDVFDNVDDSTEITLSQADFDSLPPEVQDRVPGAETFGNNKQVADSIFSQYIIAFEALSVLLLAALIGAVVVARKE